MSTNNSNRSSGTFAQPPVVSADPKASKPQADIAHAKQFSEIIHKAHFSWFIGHSLTVFGWLLYAIFTRFIWVFYIGVAVAYSIIIYRTAGPLQFSIRYIVKLLSDENSVYLILAACWYGCGVGFVDPEKTKDWFFGKLILFPYFIFAFFHSIEYGRSELLPIILPNSQDLQKRIHTAKRAVQTKALTYTALHELYAIPISLLIHIRSISFFIPIIYIRLLALRYSINNGFRKTVNKEKENWDQRILGNPETNSVIKTVYSAFIKVLSIISGAAAIGQTKTE